VGGDKLSASVSTGGHQNHMLLLDMPSVSSFLQGEQWEETNFPPVSAQVGTRTTCCYWTCRVLVRFYRVNSGRRRSVSLLAFCTIGIRTLCASGLTLRHYNQTANESVNQFRSTHGKEYNMCTYKKAKSSSKKKKTLHCKQELTANSCCFLNKIILMRSWKVECKEGRLRH